LLLQLPWAESLLVGLDYLIEDTTYRAVAREQDRIPYDEVPNIRRQAAEIAAVLRYSYGDLSAITERWITIASNDALPELREVIAKAKSISSKGVLTMEANAVTRPFAEK
jgi:hypothetical protein